MADVPADPELAAEDAEEAPRVQEAVDHDHVHGGAAGMRRSHLFPYRSSKTATVP
jgi:hypothetical protein